MGRMWGRRSCYESVFNLRECAGEDAWDEQDLFVWAGMFFADAHFGRLDDDGGAGGDIVGDPRITADDGAAADGDIAEDGGAGVDDDVVFDRGVAFHTTDLAGVRRE